MIKDMFRAMPAIFVGGVLFIVTAVAFASMWIFGFGAFQRGTANFRGETAQREKILANANYRIAAYDHFFDLCSSIQALESKSHIYADDPNTYAAIRAVRANLVAQYNGDATKNDTEAHFHDSDLPYKIDLEGDNTQCAAS